MAAVLLVNAARWQMRDGSPSMAIVLRGLSLLVAQAEGARPLCSPCVLGIMRRPSYTMWHRQYADMSCPVADTVLS